RADDESRKGGRRDGRDGGHQRESGGGDGDGHGRARKPQRGTGTVASTPSSTPSAVTPSSSTSGRTRMRWRRHGRATALTSSGVTNSLPDNHAQALAACSNMVAPRGDTPSESDGESRVARAMPTM